MDRDRLRGLLKQLLCMGVVIAILSASIIAFGEIAELTSEFITHLSPAVTKALTICLIAVLLFGAVLWATLSWMGKYARRTHKGQPPVSRKHATGDELARQGSTPPRCSSASRGRMGETTQQVRN